MESAKIMAYGINVGGTSNTAANVNYDTSISQMEEVSTVQEAIDHLNSNITNLSAKKIAIKAELGTDVEDAIEKISKSPNNIHHFVLDLTNIAITTAFGSVYVSSVVTKSFPYTIDKNIIGFSATYVPTDSKTAWLSVQALSKSEVQVSLSRGTSNTVSGKLYVEVTTE